MKKLWQLVCVLLAGATVAAAGTPIDVKVDDVTGYRGETVDVAVRITSPSLTDSDGVQSYQFDLTYDPTLVRPSALLVSGTLADTSDAQIQSNIDKLVNDPTLPPTIHIAAASSGNLLGSDSLAVVQFDVIGPSLSLDSLYLSNVLFNEADSLLGTTANGSITIGNRPPVIQPIPDATVTIGQSIDYKVHAVDPDGDNPVTFSMNSLGDLVLPFNIDSQTGAISYTPVLADTGVYQIEVWAYDTKEASSSVTFTLTIAPDRTPPAVFGVTVPPPGQRQATVTWNTNEPSTSVVKYGVSGGALSNTMSDTIDYVLQHQIVLTGLSPNVTYAYQVTSTDVSGNVSLPVSGTFTTAPSTTALPPVISQITAITTSTGATVTWNTDHFATTTLRYGPTTAFTDSADGPGAQGGHSVTVGGLTAGTAYVYSVKSTDQNGLTAVSAPDTFYTKGTTVPPVISGGVGSIVGRSQTTFTVFWKTDRAATSIIQYGSSENLGQQISDTTAVVGHSMTVTGLSSGTKYYFRVGSTGPENLGPAISGPTYGNLQNVPTLVSPDVTPPQFVVLPSAQPSNNSAIVTWQTDENSTSIVKYAVAGAPGTIFSPTDSSVTTDLTTAHSVTLLNLSISTNYNYRVISRDQSNNTATSAVFQFRTAAAKDTLPPVVTDNRIIITTDTSSASIAFGTNEPADVQIKYHADSTSAPIEVIEDGTLTKSHLESITGLTSNTPYVFTMRLRDASLNAAFRNGKFRTAAVADTIAPVIIGVPTIDAQALDTTNNTVTVNLSVTTDEPSRTSAAYGSDSTSLSGVTTPTPLAQIQRLTFTGLPPSTVIYYQLTFSDAVGNLRLGVIRQFRTRAGRDVIPPRITLAPTVVDSQAQSVTIAWWTDEAATSRLRITTDASAISTANLVEDQTFVQHHRVTATGLTPNTKYYWRITSIDPSGNRVTSAVYSVSTRAVADTTPPVFVHFPAVLYSSADVAVLQWETDENTYGNIYLAKQGAQYYNVITDETFKTTHIVPLVNLEAGQTYVFFVEAIDAAGNSSVAGDSSAPVFDGRTAIVKIGRLAKITGGRSASLQTPTTPDNTPPQITTPPSAKQTNNTSSTIDWGTNEVSNSEVHFAPLDSVGGSGKLTRATASEAAIDSLGNVVIDGNYVSDHQVTVTQLQPNTQYAMYAASTDPSGNGATKSDIVFITTPAGADLTPPVIVSSSIQALPTQTQASVRWTTDELSNSVVTYGTDSTSLGSSMTDPDPTTDHSVTLTNLTQGTKYFYRVNSTDTHSNGPTTSAVESFTTASTADNTPPVVSDVQVLDARTTNTTATISWTTNEVATSDIEYGETPALGLSMTDQNEVTSHQMTLGNLSGGVKYYFAISGTDLNGNTSSPTATDSLITSFTADVTGPNAPTQVDTVPASKQVILRWSASTSPDIASYNVYRDGNATPIATGITDTTYDDKTVTNGTTYSYQIAGVDYSNNIGPLTSMVRETPSSTESPSAPTPVSPYGWTASNVDSVTFTVANSTPAASRPGDQLSYAFVVATDSLLQNVITTKAGIPQGASTTSWTIPVYQLEATQTYYWAAQATGSVSSGPVSGIVKVYVAGVKVEVVSFAATGERSGAVKVGWELQTDASAVNRVELLRGATAAGATSVATYGPDGLKGQLIDLGVAPGATTDYWLRVTDNSGFQQVFGPTTASAYRPKAWALSPAYPNPFNPTTQIVVDVPKQDVANVTVYNILGQPVAKLWSGPITPGVHQLTWNALDREGRPVGSGMYLIRLNTGSGVRLTQRVTMLR